MLKLDNIKLQRKHIKTGCRKSNTSGGGGGGGNF